MAPGQEIALRAIGTALAGMSMAFAIYMLAYGGGKTRINGLEHLAIFAQPRGSAGGAPPAEGPALPLANGGGAVDLATTGSLAASGGRDTPKARPVEIVAARADRVRCGGNPVAVAESVTTVSSPADRAIPAHRVEGSLEFVGLSHSKRLQRHIQR